MKIEIRQPGKVRILDLNGDIATGKGNVPVEKAVQELLVMGEKRIILNMANVRWIDSGGIGLLVVLKKRAAERGAEIKMLMPQKKVYDLLTMVRLTEMYEIFDNELDAVGSF